VGQVSNLRPISNRPVRLQPNIDAVGNGAQDEILPYKASRRVSWRHVRRREFIQSAGAGALGTIAHAQTRGIPSRPNILCILADDLGYGDLSSYGRPDYRTPVLDGEGIRSTLAQCDRATAQPVMNQFRDLYAA
jgi:hypothetical protein